MRTATFDIPAALEKYLYSWLRDSGWSPRITIAPSEWDKPPFEHLRILHVGGQVEITYRPHGKRIPLHEQKWTRYRDDGTEIDFAMWIGIIKVAVQTHEASMTSAGLHE